jgi:CheY-like chemotaxis protein
MQFSTLLLVDDDLAHTRLVERNLRRTGYNREIIKLDNGQALLDWLETYLSQQEASVTAPCIFLDINMPVKNGIETLIEIKNNKKTSHIPVVMLSTSDNMDEIDNCYRAGCNAYVVKSAVQAEFKEKIREIGLFLNTISSPHLH